MVSYLYDYRLELMRRVLPILPLLLLLLTGCASSGYFFLPQPTGEPINKYNYLALGDSYTIGESVPEEERFPLQLAAALEEKNIRLDVQIIARTGWTSNELWNAIQKTELHPPYDMVTLLIGVNDQYRGNDIEQYRLEFKRLLSEAIGYAGDDPGKVIVISIPDWGVTPFAAGRDQARIAAEIDAFNSINHEEADKLDVVYIDITPFSRSAASHPELIAPDGLHPSGKMYAGWVEAILPLTLKALGAEQ
jgi:lysophospholipase L1-like esterase